VNSLYFKLNSIALFFFLITIISKSFFVLNNRILNTDVYVILIVNHIFAYITLATFFLSFIVLSGSKNYVDKQIVVSVVLFLIHLIIYFFINLFVIQTNEYSIELLPWYGIIFMPLSMIILIFKTNEILRNLPEWVTDDRKHWLNLLQTGIIWFVAYFVIDLVVSGIPSRFLSTQLVTSSPITRGSYLKILAFSVLILSGNFLNFSVNLGSKWFFDEIKYRAGHEMFNKNPNVNFSEIWQNVDTFEDDDESDTVDINELDDYIMRIKNLSKS